MDVQQILIATLLGALFAAVGAGIGVLSARAFPEKFKSSLIAVFSVVGIIASQTIHDEMKAGSLKSELQDGLEQNELFATLKEAFPSDYSRFLSDLSRVKTPNAGFELGQKFTSELRKNNAIHARSASKTHLVAQLELELELLDSIRTQEGELVCNAFLSKGVPGLPGGYESYQSEISASVEALFLALENGRETGQLRTSPTASDWEAFLEVWRTSGASDEEVALVLSPNPEDQNYCASHMSFLSGIIAYDGLATDSIRAELLFQKAIAD